MKKGSQGVVLFVIGMIIVISLFSLVLLLHDKDALAGKAHNIGEPRQVLGNVAGTDDQITIQDATTIVEHVVGRTLLQGNNLLLADVNCDRLINVRDVISTVRKVLNPTLVYSCPPILAAIGNQQIVVGQELSFTVTAEDPEHGVYTLSAANLPTGAIFDSATDEFRWVPDASQVGIHTVIFTVTDDESMIDSESVSIVVTAAPPIISSPPSLNNQNINSSLGINLGSLRDYLPAWVFVDAFANSRDHTNGWQTVPCSGGADTGQALPQDINGWITDLPAGTCASVVLFGGLTPLARPAGTYVILWDGDLNAEFSLAGNGLSNYAVDSSRPGRATFELSSTAGSFTFMIRNFNPVNYPRNIRILMPGGVCGTSATNLDPFCSCQTSRGGTGAPATGQQCFDFEQVYWNRFSDPPSQMNNPKIVFHPVFLNVYRPFKSIRFQNWQNINALGGSMREINPIVNWEDVNPITYRTMGRFGYNANYYYITALANVLNTDVWVNVPHKASDQFIQRFAQFLKDNLNPHLDIHVEYTNEAWNPVGGFCPQHLWMIQNGGCAELAGQDTNALCATPGGIQNLFPSTCLALGERYYAERTVDIGRILKTTFADQPGRVTVVLSSQATADCIPSTGPDNVECLSERLLDYAQAYGGSQAVDALAVAPYFGYNIRVNELNPHTEDALFERLCGSIDCATAPPIPPTLEVAASPSTSALARTIFSMHQQTQVAGNYNIHLVAYEGGQHLVPGSIAQDIDLVAEANRDVRMGRAYDYYFRAWKNAGGQIFHHLGDIANPSPDGAWGLLEQQDQDPETSVKYTAVMNFIGNNSCWWENCSKT